MPIPISIDPLNREWVEMSGKNPKFVDEYRPCLVSFLAFDHGHSPDIAGSGFIIGVNEDYAFSITAKHVLTEGVLEIQKPYTRHAPSSPFIPPSAKNPSIGESKLRAIWSNSENADMLLTRHIGYNENFDIACVMFEAQKYFLLDVKIEGQLATERIMVYKRGKKLSRDGMYPQPVTELRKKKR